MTEANREHPGVAPGPGLRGALVAAATAGLGLSGYLVLVKLRLALDPEYQSSCNFGDGFNCDVVQTSDYSTVLGAPLALWGAAFYLGVIVLVAAMGRAERARSALALLAVGTVPVLLHSLWLATISKAVIGSFCLFCVGMYASNFAIAGLAWWGVRRSSIPLAEASRSGAPLLAVVAAIAGVAVTQLGYRQIEASMTADRIAAAQAELAGAQVAAGAASATGAAATEALNVDGGDAGAAVAATAAEAAASRQRPAPAAADASIHQHPEGFRYGDAVSKKGRVFFEVPVTEHDFVLGPTDAPVTVVEFADFECGYCRALTQNISPLKKRYAGRVRWVFKHFPLDNRCNKVMKGTMHPNACDAAKASNCAGLQGKFWQMHDRIYSESLRLNLENLRNWAGELGVDLKQWDACMANDAIAHRKTEADSMAGRFARIAGTPRTYVNGHLVPGIVSTEVFAYYLDAALERAKGAPAAPAPVQARQQHGMVEVTAAEPAFWIDAYEASIDAKGRALSRADVAPAEVSWFEANAACTAAGKRMCSEVEWITACAGQAPKDDDGDGDVTDDAPEGSLYPYGPFHVGGRCHDDGKNDDAPVATGSKSNCRSASGIFDQSGNVAEWTGRAEADAMLSGGDFRYGAKATCFVRQTRFGKGYRNRTTGFRCCADAPVAPPQGAEVTEHADHGAEGEEVPPFEVTARDGRKLDAAWLKGHVTIVSFFASWCGPCRREMPELERFYQENKAAGLRILSIGVDTRRAQSEAFVDEVKPSFEIAFDPEAVSMGAFGVKGMPTTFLVGRDGKIAQRLVGINAEKVKAFQDAAKALLAAK